MIATIDPVDELCSVTVTLPSPVARTGAAALGTDEAETYAAWFATLADPTRVRLLHAVATAPAGDARRRPRRALGISQSTARTTSTCSEVGFVLVDKVGTSTRVRVNAACCTGLPHAADVVMGTLASLPCCPEDLPDDVSTRAVTDDDLPAVLESTPRASPPATPPSRPACRRRRRCGPAGCPASPGWPSSTARSSAGPRSPRCRPASATRASASPRSTSPTPRAGVGWARRCCSPRSPRPTAAGLWTLQTSVFPENRASLALHRSAGYRTLAVRTRIARLDGVWRDTVLLERRSEVDYRPADRSADADRRGPRGRVRAGRGGRSSSRARRRARPPGRSAPRRSGSTSPRPSARRRAAWWHPRP